MSTRGRFTADGRPCSFLLDDAGGPLLVLAHGAGAPFTSAFLETTARALAERGLSVLRFHFPYMEEISSGGRRRPPDPPRRLLAAWREALRIGREAGSGRRMAMAGKSLGGRMASLLLAKGVPEDVRAAVYLGYPLHPPGDPGKLRAEHLPAVAVPQLFVSGSKDPLCKLDLLEPVLARLAGASLFVVQGGDHSLALSRKQPVRGTDAWVDAVASFVRRHCE